MNFVAARQSLAICRGAIDSDVGSGRRLDIGVPIADSNRGVMEGDGEALKAEVVVGAAPELERLDLE